MRPLLAAAEAKDELCLECFEFCIQRTVFIDGDFAAQTGYLAEKEQHIARRFSLPTDLVKNSSRFI